MAAGRSRTGRRSLATGHAVTAMNWETLSLSGPATSGNLGCNFSGAIFISHGIDAGCAFQTGFNITCNAGRITHFQVVEGAACPRART